MIWGWNMLGAVPVLSLLCSTAIANIIQLDMNEMECVGMYSKKDWGGPVDPYIEVNITDTKSGKDDDWIALVIFEHRNLGLLGADIPMDPTKKYVCDDSAIASNLCDKEQQGQFIVSGLANSTSYGKILTQRLDFRNPETVKYNVEKSGFYCVYTYTPNKNDLYSGVAEFRNAFGHLAASQIPKLPFYGGAALAYAVVLVLWMLAYLQHRATILPVQNYITAICGFLVVEMIVNWRYYAYMNSRASTGTTYAMALSVLSAFRYAYTFFLLLILCMGYGMVKQSLGRTKWECLTLAGLYFVFTLLSAYVITPGKASPFVMFLCFLSLTVTLTIFVLWIMNSLTSTIRKLEGRLQYDKAERYRTLWQLLLGSILLLCVYAITNFLFFMAEEPTLDSSSTWKSRWFILEEFPNLVYFVDFSVIAYIWRPNTNDVRFMSSKIAQDENEVQEFEIGSLRESMDE